MSCPSPDKVHDSFKKSRNSYDDEAYVQKIVGVQLVESLAALEGIRSGRVMEIGCCTGLMTETLCRNLDIQTLYLNDLVADLCSRAVGRIEGAVHSVIPLTGNVERISLPGELDLIVSSSTFQWLENFNSAMFRLSESLVRDGYLVFSMFSPGTYRQIRDLIGVGLNYLDEEQVRKGLENEFQVLKLETTHHPLEFPGPRNVLRHIQLTGVGGAGNFRWTPGRLRRFEAAYREKYSTDNGVHLDYFSTSVIARKR